VLADASEKYQPIEWAKIAIAAYQAHRADRIVAERNNGGDMVEATIRMVDPNVSVTTVWASRGKATRAEPISALYEQWRMHYVGTFPQLEDQMANFTADFDREKAGYSPDRLDALVCAATELLVEQMKGYGIFEVMRRRAAGETLEQIAGMAENTPEREKKTSLQEIYGAREVPKIRRTNARLLIPRFWFLWTHRIIFLSRRVIASGHLGFDALHYAGAGAALARGFENALAACQRRTDCRFFRCANPRPTDRFAALRADDTRPGYPSVDAFLNDRALELGEHTQHLKQRAARRRSRVDRLPIQIQIATGTIQLTQEAHKILQRATEPVYGPCRDYIDPATGGRLEQPIEPSALVTPFGAADSVVDKFLNDPPSPRLACRCQGLALVFDRLVGDRNPQIEPNSLAVHAETHYSRKQVFPV
jgi:hypothetical protein